MEPIDEELAVKEQKKSEPRPLMSYAWLPVLSLSGSLVVLSMGISMSLRNLGLNLEDWVSPGHVTQKQIQSLHIENKRLSSRVDYLEAMAHEPNDS